MTAGDPSPVAMTRPLSGQQWLTCAGLAAPWGSRSNSPRQSPGGGVRQRIPWTHRVPSPRQGHSSCRRGRALNPATWGSRGPALALCLIRLVDEGVADNVKLARR